MFVQDARSKSYLHIVYIYTPYIYMDIYLVCIILTLCLIVCAHDDSRKQRHHSDSFCLFQWHFSTRTDPKCEGHSESSSLWWSGNNPHQPSPPKHWRSASHRSSPRNGSDVQVAKTGKTKWNCETRHQDNMRIGKSGSRTAYHRHSQNPLAYLWICRAPCALIVQAWKKLLQTPALYTLSYHFDMYRIHVLT